MVRSPPKSADLNPIEWVWADLKRFVRKRLCRNESELVRAIHDFQEKFTPQYCGKFINYLKKVNII